METTLTEIGLEMWQDDEDLVWELQLPNNAILRLDKEALERLVYRLNDELRAMQRTRGYATGLEDEDEDLPEGTDNIDMLPDSGDDIGAVLDAFDDFDIVF